MKLLIRTVMYGMSRFASVLSIGFLMFLFWYIKKRTRTKASIIPELLGISLTEHTIVNVLILDKSLSFDFLAKSSRKYNRLWMVMMKLIVILYVKNILGRPADRPAGVIARQITAWIQFSLLYIATAKKARSTVERFSFSLLLFCSACVCWYADANQVVST